VLDGLSHLALMLIQISYLAVGPAHIVVVLDGLRVVEKSLVYLAKVLAYVPFHLQSLYLGVVESNYCVAELVAPLRVPQFVLDLRQN
jgi:hypothetical protein